MKLLTRVRATIRRGNASFTPFLQRVLALLGQPKPIDPDVDRWVRRAFVELRQGPLFEPTRDVSRAVLDQIQRMRDKRS